MASPRRSAAMSMDEAANATARPGKVAAFIPVDSNGTPTTADEEDWRMRTGSQSLTEIPTEDFDDDEPVEQTPADRIIAMLRGVNDGDRAYLKVSRVAQGNKIEFCTDYSAADFEAGGLKMIQEQWGPGEYQLILYGTKHLPSGKDHFGIRDRTSVRIAAPLTREGVPVQQASSELPQFMQQMAQTQERLLQALENRPAPVDPMVQMTQMFGMMKLMREAMGMDQAPKKENALGDIVAAMRELREVSEEFGPQSSKPAGPMEMVKDMLPMIATAMQARQNPVPAAPVQTQPPVATTTPPAESEDMNLSEIMKQKAYLATLVQMGKDGRQTDEAAKFVYDNLSDDLIDLMAQDDWFTMFKAIAGDIDPQREWFQKVRDEALALFDAPDSENKSITGL